MTPDTPSPSFPKATRPWSRRVLVFGGLSVLLGLALVLGVVEGAVQIPASEVWRSVLGLEQNSVVSDLRLPRVLGAMLVGGALGLSGAAFQGLFRNPLADPYLMGSAAGAAFGFTVAISLGGALGAAYQTPIFSQLPSYAPWLAFLGSVGAVVLTLLLSGGASRTHDLILAGTVVSSVLIGLSTYIMLKDADRIRAVFAYVLGNLAFLNWNGVRTLALYLLASLPLFFGLSRTLNALSLGEETARSLGLPLSMLKFVLIGLVTLLTAIAVIQAGIIGFVGLIVPHVLRRLLGGDYRYLLPASLMGGAALLVFADLLARTLTRPAELPVGVVTTLLGGPFFLYLLWRGRGKA